MSNRRLSQTKNLFHDLVNKRLDGNIAVMSGSSTPPRWVCNHHSDGSDVIAYVRAVDSLAVIALTRAAEGIDARANAELIVNAVNAYERCQPLIAELAAALEKFTGRTLSPNEAQEVVNLCHRGRRVVGE